MEGKGFSVGEKVKFLLSGGGDNWQWKQRNVKRHIEQFAIALSLDSEADSDSRDTAMMVAMVRGKEGPEMVQAILEFVENQLDEMEKVEGVPSLTIDGVICLFSFVLTADAAFTLEAIGHPACLLVQGEAKSGWSLEQLRMRLREHIIFRGSA